MARGSPGDAEQAGGGVAQVMAHPSVDPTRTVSNHLIEIIEVLGIEAARNALMKVRPQPHERARSRS